MLSKTSSARSGLSAAVAMFAALACTSTSTNSGNTAEGGAGGGGGAGAHGGAAGVGGASGAAGSGGTGAGVCTPGEQRCVGKVPQFCDTTGQWQDGSTCPYVCANGGCSGVCSPGALQCSGATPQTCDATGTWQSGATCVGSLPQCSSGACVDACGGNCTYQTACPSNVAPPGVNYVGSGWSAECVPQPPSYTTGVCMCKCSQTYTCMYGYNMTCTSSGC